MNTLLPAALAFSLVATLAVGLAGRRDAAGSDRLSALALGILLILPLLVLLPGWSVLPAGGSSGTGGTAAFLVWLAPLGTAIIILRLVHASLRLRRWIRLSLPLDHRVTPEGRCIEIRTLSGLKSPCATGVRQPVILVPPSWATLPPAHREMVLAHEIAHHRRRDPLWRLVGAIACAVHWFNPLVWWLARRHAFQCELACDAAVLATGTPPDRYAHLLCDLAQARPEPLVAGIGGSMLGRRVERLRQPRPRLSPAWLIANISLLMIIGLAFGLSRPAEPIPPSEVHLRLTAEPFPAR